MPIQQVHVENFKSFSELDIDLSRFNVVIGSNAAGKSNFISIFKFLRDIACHGLANAIAMQGGSEYIRNTKIGNLRNLVIRVAFQPDQKLDIIDHKADDNSLLGIQSCESTYEFAIRFDAEGDGFAIVKDRLVIGCEVSSCERTGTSVRKNCTLGRGEIQVTNEQGEVKFVVNIPDGCPLSEEEIIPVFFRNVHLQKDALLLESPYAYPLPHVEKFFDRTPCMISIQSSRSGGLS